MSVFLSIITFSQYLQTNVLIKHKNCLVSFLLSRKIPISKRPISKPFHFTTSVILNVLSEPTVFIFSAVRLPIVSHNTIGWFNNLYTCQYPIRLDLQVTDRLMVVQDIGLLIDCIGSDSKLLSAQLTNANGCNLQ